MSDKNKKSEEAKAIRLEWEKLRQAVLNERGGSLTVEIVSPRITGMER